MSLPTPSSLFRGTSVSMMQPGASVRLRIHEEAERHVKLFPALPNIEAYSPTRRRAPSPGL